MKSAIAEIVPGMIAHPGGVSSFVNFDKFEVGGVYNRTYIGDNEAYKAQNGKKTIRIISIVGEQIMFHTLFDQFPTFGPNNEFQSGPTTASLPHWVQADEYLYEQVFDESQYYKHIEEMTMKEAVERKLVTVERLSRVFRNQSSDYMKVNPVAYDHCRDDESGNKIYGRSLRLPAEQGVSDNPMLQSISFFWNSTEEFEKDVLSVYPEAWFMK